MNCFLKKKPKEFMDGLSKTSYFLNHLTWVETKAGCCGASATANKRSHPTFAVTTNNAIVP